MSATPAGPVEGLPLDLVEELHIVGFEVATEAAAEPEGHRGGGAPLGPPQALLLAAGDENAGGGGCCAGGGGWCGCCVTGGGSWWAGGGGCGCCCCVTGGCVGAGALLCDATVEALGGVVEETLLCDHPGGGGTLETGLCKSIMPKDCQ